jgi:hypothetical protein
MFPLRPPAAPLLTAVVALLVLVGCTGRHAGSKGGSVVSTTSAAVSTGPGREIVALVRTEDDDPDDEPRGVLVIRAELIEACPAVLEASAPHGNESMQWLYLMRSIAGCAKRNELGMLVLRGPSRPQAITRSIFSHLGVSEEAVVLTSAPGQRACADDDCAPEERRVEVGLGVPPDVATSL